MNESQKNQYISSTIVNTASEITLISQHLTGLDKLLKIAIYYISSESKDPSEINETIQGLPSSSTIGELPNDFTNSELYTLMSDIFQEQRDVKYTNRSLHELQKAVNTRTHTPSQGFYEINKSARGLDVVQKGVIGLPLPTEWNQIGSSISGSGIGSGSNISLSGDGKRIAFTTPEDLNATGHVKVYEFIGNTWVQIGSTIQGELEQDASFGLFTSLSMDGNTVAIGWPAHQTTGDSTQEDYRAGHVKIYKYNCHQNTWIQVGSNINGVIFGRLGSWLQLSNNGLKVIIGEPNFGDDTLLIEGTTDPQPFFGGIMRVFEYNGLDWVKLGSDIIGQREFDKFGGCVTISNNGLVVAGSSIYWDSSSTGTNEDWSGHTRVYEFKCGDWVQLGTSIIGEAVIDNSGQSIYLSGDGKRIAISAPNNDGDGEGKTNNDDFQNSYNSGHVRVFEYNGTDWVQLGSDINNENQSDGSMGIPVCLSEDGNILAMGVPASENNTGSIKAFEYDGTEWVQLGDTLEGASSSEIFGFSISLSEDGRTLASGNPGSNTVSMYELK